MSTITSADATSDKSPPAQEFRLENFDLLLTVDEAARRLGIGRSHAYVFVMKGELESVKVGRCRRVVAESLPAFVQRLRSLQQE